MYVTSPAVSVEYITNSVPSVEKQNVIRIMVITRTGAYILGVRQIIISVARVIHTTPRLQKNPFRLSPNTSE
jgi:hypothetical protein